MKFAKLTTPEQFINLKKGDLIIVKWSDYTVKHTKGIKKIQSYNIALNKTEGSYTEIICQTRNNHYFNWDRYLKGLSGAEEVYLIENSN